MDMAVPMKTNNTNLLIYFGILSMILAMFAVLSIHALERHGLKAELVKYCMQEKGPIQEWLQPNGRIARVCQLDNGKFGIEIVDQEGRNITAFIKNKMRSLEQVEQYLINKGARLLWSK